MRCSVAGAKSGNYVVFRQKEKRKASLKNFFVIIFVLYSQIPYFSKEQLILADA